MPGEAFRCWVHRFLAINLITATHDRRETQIGLNRIAATLARTGSPKVIVEFDRRLCAQPCWRHGVAGRGLLHRGPGADAYVYDKLPVASDV